MYLTSRRARQRRRLITSIAMSAVAFLCTLCVLVFAISMRGPVQSALALRAATRTLAPIATRATDMPKSLASPTAPPSSTPVPDTPTQAPTLTQMPPTLTTTPTVAPPTNTALPTAIPYPQHVVQDSAGPIVVVEHFLLGRPVPLDADGISPEWHYLYGTTEGGTLRVHHADDFDNPLGTPLYAVADGSVVFARLDDQPICGAAHDQICGAHANFYGNFVVEQLDQTYHGQPIYIVYGHMDSIGTTEGQHVTSGQQIGVVGSTGVSMGPHVHLETRIGENDYGHTRNTSLWLKPLPGRGVLSGRVLDQQGQPVVGGVVDLYDASGNNELELTETYGTDETPAVNPDDDMKENFALPDLPAGTYRLRVEIGGSSYYKTVTVDANHITFVVMRPS